MELKDADGGNEDFIGLSEELDQEFYELLGADQDQFNEFNTLEDIHDVVLVYDGETAVACGGFKRYTGATAEVKRIYVKKEYRKKGLAGKVLQALEEKGKKKGYQYFILETSKKQLPALALYKSIHYQQIDRYPPYEKIELSVCMQKQIR